MSRLRGLNAMVTGCWFVVRALCRARSTTRMTGTPQMLLFALRWGFCGLTILRRASNARRSPASSVVS